MNIVSIVDVKMRHAAGTLFAVRPIKQLDHRLGQPDECGIPDGDHVGSGPDVTLRDPCTIQRSRVRVTTDDRVAVSTTQAKITVAEFHTKSVVAVTAQRHGTVVTGKGCPLVIGTAELTDPIRADVRQQPFVPVLVRNTVLIGRVKVVNRIVLTIANIG